MKVDDNIVIYYDATKAPKLSSAIANDLENVSKVLKKPFHPLSEKKALLKVVENSLVTFKVEEE